MLQRQLDALNFAGLSRLVGNDIIAVFIGGDLKARISKLKICREGFTLACVQVAKGRDPVYFQRHLLYFCRSTSKFRPTAHES